MTLDEIPLGGYYITIMDKLVKHLLWANSLAGPITKTTTVEIFDRREEYQYSIPKLHLKYNDSKLCVRVRATGFNGYVIEAGTLDEDTFWRSSANFIYNIQIARAIHAMMCDVYKKYKSFYVPV